MDQVSSMFTGTVTHVRFHATLLPRRGWSLLVQTDHQDGAIMRRRTERFTDLSRGELIDVVDAIREQLDLPLSEYA